MLGLRGLDGRVLFQFALRIEASGEDVGCRHKRQHVVCEDQHGDQQFLRTNQLFGPAATIAAAFDGTGHLRKVQHSKTRVGMPMRVPRSIWSTARASVAIWSSFRPIGMPSF